MNLAYIIFLHQPPTILHETERMLNQSEMLFRM